MTHYHDEEFKELKENEKCCTIEKTRYLLNAEKLRVNLDSVFRYVVTKLSSSFRSCRQQDTTQYTVIRF